MIFNGAGERVGNPFLVLPSFPGSVISTTALHRCFHVNRSGTGDSLLHCRSSVTFAAIIFRAQAVSLIAAAC